MTTLDGLIPDWGPLSYGELRRLEYLLGRYRSSLGGTGTAPPAIMTATVQVLTDVARKAGKAQRAVERQCSWCGKMHTDPPPDLCNSCNSTPRTAIAAEGAKA